MANITPISSPGGVPGKRRPGRPRKDKQNPDEPHYGIITELQENLPGVVSLFICSRPLIFVKLAKLFKEYKIETVEITFTPTGVVFYAEDHSKTSDIYVKLNGESLTSYYCKEELSILVQRTALHTIWGSLSKTCSRCDLSVNKMSSINIMSITIDPQTGARTEHTISAEENYGRIHNSLADVVDYPLSFCWEAKYFKTKMREDHNKATHVMFLYRDNSLSFQYGGVEPVITSVYFDDPAAIKLEYKGRADDILTANLCITDVKPFANAAISDTPIRIHIDPRRKMAFTGQIENIEQIKKYLCEVRMFCNTKESVLCAATEGVITKLENISMMTLPTMK